MLFSMLANLAEDRQGGLNESGQDVATALQRLDGEGVRHASEVAALLDRALIVPVLTAHPTEVMRKSMIDHRNRIAELMLQRDAGLLETPQGDIVEQAILRQIALLWQTRPLRRERIQVADEVEIALSYLRDVFLPVLPRLYARWERLLPHRPQCFLRLGTLDRRRPRWQSQCHCGHAGRGAATRVADVAGQLPAATGFAERGTVDLHGTVQRHR